MPPRSSATRDLVVFVATLAPIAAWSAWGPKDRFTWWLEVVPVFAGVATAWIVRGRFALSRLLLVLLWLHSVILLVGGHYTYAEVPLGEWVREALGRARNDYDKLGHFAQGFVPALLAREILLRTSPLGDERGRPASAWLNFLCGSVAMAFSAVYELIEWAAAAATGEAAESFLGTQGYVWDTQSDMGWALAGALASLILLSRLHDGSVARVPRPTLSRG
jgi:putative membrane protein